MSCENYQEALGRLHDSLRTDSHEYDISGKLRRRLGLVCRYENGTSSSEKKSLMKTSEALLNKFGVQIKSPNSE